MGAGKQTRAILKQVLLNTELSLRSAINSLIICQQMNHFFIVSSEECTEVKDMLSGNTALIIS